MGKSSINGPFSMAMLNNQRVFLICLAVDIFRLSERIPWILASAIQRSVEQTGTLSIAKQMQVLQCYVKSKNNWK